MQTQLTLGFFVFALVGGGGCHSRPLNDCLVLDYLGIAILAL